VTLPILVVGGGIGGLATALGLLRAGLPVRLFEQAAAIAEVGAGLSLTPNACKALRFLGLGRWLEEVATQLDHQLLFDATTGALLLEHDRRPGANPWGAPYAVAHRADLVDALVGAIHALDPGAIHTDARVAALHAMPNSVAIETIGGGRIDGVALIGADGARSLVRDAMFGDAAPEFAGHVAWRALLPGEAVPHADLPLRQSRAWAGPGATFVAYRLRHGELVNLVGLSRSARWRAEGWREAAPVAEARAVFAGFPAPVGRMLDAIEDETIASWGLFRRPHAAALASGRVALVGDSGHPMLPFMGQGAAMALEDAVVLARASTAMPDDPHAALQRYDRARAPRTRAVMAASAAGADRLQATRPDPSRNEDVLGIFAYDPATQQLECPASGL
jgi:salicylate hydroxylase